MPKIYEYFGLIFFFYSNEHEPVHVHVSHAGKESVFELIMKDGVLVEIKKRGVRFKNKLSIKDEKEAVLFIEKYHKNIIDKWIKFFVLKERVKSTKITKKI